MYDYVYMGDKLTDLSLRGRFCNKVINRHGKCTVGKLGTMLVSFDGVIYNVIRRRLRKLNKMNTDREFKIAILIASLLQAGKSYNDKDAYLLFESGNFAEIAKRTYEALERAGYCLKLTRD